MQYCFSCTYYYVYFLILKSVLITFLSVESFTTHHIPPYINLNFEKLMLQVRLQY